MHFFEPLLRREASDTAVTFVSHLPSLSHRSNLLSPRWRAPCKTGVGEHLGIPVWVPSLVDLDPCLDPRMKRRLKVRGAAAEACFDSLGMRQSPVAVCLVASSSSQKLRLHSLICFAELGQSMHLLAFLRRSLLHILARIRFGPAHLLLGSWSCTR